MVEIYNIKVKDMIKILLIPVVTKQYGKIEYIK